MCKFVGNSDLLLLIFHPEANKYFVDYISKAYQALTDPVSRENYEKYGHPDGRQVSSLLHSLFATGSCTETLNTYACVLGYFIAGNANGHRSTFIPSEHSRSSEWRYLAGFGWARHLVASYDRCCLPFALLKVYWKLCDAPDFAELLLLHEAISCTQVRSSLGTDHKIRFCFVYFLRSNLLTI